MLTLRLVETKDKEDEHTQMTLGPIRCTLCVKSSLDPGGSQRTKIHSSLRGYIAETYAKVMGSSSSSQPSLKPECTLSFCS